jgi:hypothetical protein
MKNHSRPNGPLEEVCIILNEAANRCSLNQCSSHHLGFPIFFSSRTQMIQKSDKGRIRLHTASWNMNVLLLTLNGCLLTHAWLSSVGKYGATERQTFGITQCLSTSMTCHFELKYISTPLAMHFAEMESGVERQRFWFVFGGARFE